MTENSEVDGSGGGDNETVKHTYAKNYQKLKTKLLSGAHEALILIGLYNGQRLIDIKSLSSC